MSIKAVLFDLGKVLLHFDFTPAFKRLSRHCLHDPETVRRFFLNSELEVLYDGGKIGSAEFYRRVRKGLGLRTDYAGFRDIWNGIFTPVPGMAALVKRLKKKKRLVLISNTNAMHFEYLRGRYPVLGHFDRHILSFKEKVRKPDERIYRTAQKACKALPEEIFYIDDREDLTSAAEELGFHVHTFRNDLSALTAKLREKGVL
jgi:glucose-1-phosphatase